MRYILFALNLILVFSTTGQNLHGIDTQIDPNSQDYRSVQQYLAQKPKEIGFNVKREGNLLYLTSNDERFLKTMLSGKADGVAIDIVPKSIYACDTNYTSSQIKGKLQPPVSAKKLFRKYDKGKKRYSMPVAKIPTSMQKQELEYNILFLKNMKLTSYYTIYNLQSYPWQLLDMGLYFDNIVYKNRIENADKTIERFKTLKFVVPFEKNKSAYDAVDIRPLYDSLKLTDFNIRKIDIRAYASVEGSTENNLKLQQGRAQSIVDALQSFQTDAIETNISTAENWVEFYDGITETDYVGWSDLSKEEIKAQLKGAASKELEPILSKHRKAVVTLRMNRIDRLEDKTEKELSAMFTDAFEKQDEDRLSKVFYTLLDKVLQKNNPESLKELTVPRQAKYADFLSAQESISFWMDDRQALIALNAVKKLMKLDPKSKRLHYNATVFKFKLLQARHEGVTVKSLEKDIKDLRKYGIAGEHIKRFMINLNIIKAQRFYQDRKYREKDRAVDFILQNYKKTDMSDADYVSLAQYLSYLASAEKSEKLLEPRAKDLTVSEDLLFYYLNLTIVDKELTAKSDYRSIMLNAIDKNQSRFCGLFDPAGDGGVTFQLLENEYLRKTYCEICQ